MKKLDRVIVKFKCYKRKSSIIYKCKNLGKKSRELTNLKLSGRLFVSDSMSHRNTFGKCRQLKSTRKVHCTWFFKSPVNVKHARIHKIFHVTDIENLLEADNFEELLITYLFN